MSRSSTLRFRRFPRTVWIITAFAAAAAAAAAAVMAAAGNDRPAVLQALEQQGVTVIGKFPSAGGLTAWAAHAGGQPVALYVTPDEKHVIAGTLLDAEGNDVNRAALQKAVNGKLLAGAWGSLQSSHWVRDGKAGAPRVVYVFTDPNCPYCNKFWADARPWVESGKVELRHVIVGILTPTSPGKAAAILAAKDPAAALEAYERGHAAANATTLATGRPRPLDDAGLKPLENIPADLRSKLASNQELMASLGLQATPAMVWREPDGTVQMRTGAPPSSLASVLGPR